jgi:hypothetical protein
VAISTKWSMLSPILSQSHYDYASHWPIGYVLNVIPSSQGVIALHRLRGELLDAISVFAEERFVFTPVIEMPQRSECDQLCKGLVCEIRGEVLTLREAAVQQGSVGNYPVFAPSFV